MIFVLHYLKLKERMNNLGIVEKWGLGVGIAVVVKYMPGECFVAATRLLLSIVGTL